MKQIPFNFGSTFQVFRVRLDMSFSVTKQRGQATTEFIVIALALIPLFLLTPMIGKYQDISHAAVMASRYAAFDAMTHNEGMNSVRPSSELAGDVRRRFFSNPDAALKTKDTAGDFKANQNLFWRDPKDDPLIKNFSDIAVSNSTSVASDNQPFLLLSGLFGLQAKGIYTADVVVTLANLPKILGYTNSYHEFESISLSMARSTSLVVDPWMASGPVQAEQRFGGNPGVFPASSLANITPIVGAATATIDYGLSPPKLGKLDFWRDNVPADRLQ